MLPVFVNPSICCCCSEGCECDSSPLTCVHKVFIFYKDWMFILSKVWACECWKKKSQQTYNCTAMSVCSCLRGVDCVIKKCAVNQWLYVQPCPAETTQRGKKNLFNFNSCLRLCVLGVACFVDGLSRYFAYRLCLKRDTICIDLSVCWL